jgi:hypothetical protein
VTMVGGLPCRFLAKMLSYHVKVNVSLVNIYRSYDCIDASSLNHFGPVSETGQN